MLKEKKNKNVQRKRNIKYQKEAKKQNGGEEIE